MGTEVKVAEIPKCSFHCGDDAKYDGRTVHGSWAYMCEKHWQQFGPGKLGTGHGQKLIKETKNEV